MAETEHPRKAFGWAATDSSGVLSPFNFSRRNNGADDVTLKILYCGICHSDLHVINNDWGVAKYPYVPGHEIIGIVTEVGHNVRKLEIGDNAGIGCMIGSCRSCNNCNENLENNCPKITHTYGSTDTDGTRTYGGYSDMIVANQHFVVKIPDSLPLDKVAPLLCAGITVYSPLNRFGFNRPGMHVGVVGLGGLGHVAVKFAKAFGVKVTVISSSASKEKEAIEQFGADSFLISTNPMQMMTKRGTLDGILDTVSAPHEVEPLMSLLKTRGTMIMLGALIKPLELSVFSLLFGEKILAGSSFGGMKETQEMLDFAGKHNITAEIELIRMEYVNQAMARLAKGDVRYRFVIDVANSFLAA